MKVPSRVTTDWPSGRQCQTERQKGSSHKKCTSCGCPCKLSREGKGKLRAPQNHIETLSVPRRTAGMARLRMHVCSEENSDGNVTKSEAMLLAGQAVKRAATYARQHYSLVSSIHKPPGTLPCWKKNEVEDKERHPGQQRGQGMWALPCE
jgi:hypothetical protein